MPLPDEDTGVVDALGESQFEDLGLETALHEVLDTQTEHVIELHFGLIQHSNTHKTTQKGVSYKEDNNV